MYYEFIILRFAFLSIVVQKEWCKIQQFVEHELESSSLVELKLPEPIPPREIGFLYHHIQPFNDNILKFINIKLN